ncbi:transglutaminase-like domain-containing protein [Cytophagales bacterium LB-30]|uniref:Transglutaminase-like domain-containing protein n=1 Tax=Shiella aurantiaca TaxID=3058365 RepID=A0ABT8F8H9_9BACT|nr:transglutaminase-like domain-containing protein [Shiella aurantiaca]MDN4166511.1 transglutaminase-like domain-containing protein [Shiella aurantiaca]
MNAKELQALVSLLDDEDAEVSAHVEQKIMSLGHEVIPFLEMEWEKSFNPILQKRLEEMVHTIQFDALLHRLKAWNESSEQDLLEGMWLVATFQYPDLDLAKLREQIEQLYYEAWLDFKPNLNPYDYVKILNSVLFGKLRFGANTKNFHAPANSMINSILETRKGNPIALCSIYLLIAQKLGLPIYGVNLPNLFILTYKTEEVQFYINAFNRGLIFTKEDIDNYIQHLQLSPNPIFYQPCTHADIVRRMLRNLEYSFEKLGDHAKSEEIKRLIIQISDSEDTGII